MVLNKARPIGPPLLVFAVIGTLLPLFGCGGSPAGRDGRPGPDVVATTTQAADLARAVAGRRAGVAGILAPNADPHEYEPRPSDAAKLARAQLVIRSGGDVDRWLTGLVETAGGSARVLTLIDAVAARPGPGGTDPHWWQDPRNAQAAVRAIRDALADADPAGAPEYRANAARELRALARLDRAIAGCVARVPSGRRTLVTSHDALGYLAGRYGIRLVGTVIPGLSTQAQPSARGIAQLVATIRREHVSTVFAEQSVNRALAQAVARESGARIGPPLYADALGPAGSAGATLLGALRFNASAILTSMGARCRLPAAPAS